MRKLFTLLIALTLWAGSSWAQTTATIGTGTTNSTNYGPVYTWGAANTFDYCIYNYLFLPAELAAAGIPVGSTITKLAWYKSSAFATTGAAKYDIWLRNTTNTNQTNGVLWGTVITGSTLAYSSISQTIPATVGWIEFTLTTPIIYTGGSLEIATNWDISAVVGNPTNGGFNWNYSNLAFNGTVGQSSSEPLNSLSYLSAYGTGGPYRPNIQITHQPTPACSGTPAPGNTLASANPICSGATLTLSLQNAIPGLGVAYHWESSPNGLEPWTAISNQGALLVTSQTTETWYRCKVICDVNTGISTPVQVTMNNFLNCYCSSAANTVHEEDITWVKFGSTLNNTSILESLTGSQGTATGTPDFYSNFTAIPATAVNRMVLTPISVEITQSRGLAYAFGHGVRVYIDFNQNGQLTDAGEQFIIWPYTISTTHTISGNILIPANAALGNTLMRVVCKEQSTITPCLVGSWGETEDYLINIGEVPACIPPGLLAATNQTGFQATLGWQEGGSATSWDIEWGLTPFTPTGTPNITGVTNPYVLTGLTPVTGYTFYVRANCDGVGNSAWSGPCSFTTTVACVAPTALTASGFTTTSAILGWTAPGSLFDIEWGLKGFTPKGTPNVTGVANPYTLGSLQQATAYQYYVRQDCGVNGVSLWSGPYTFITACDAINVLPWNEGFEGMATVGNNTLPICWSYANILNYNTTCNATCNNFTAHSGTKFLYGTNNFNVWNYTPAFQLTAGTSYTFTYWVKCRNSTPGSSVTLAYGTAPDAASMTNVVGIEIPNNTVWAQKSYTFTPTTSGVYYFGLHNVTNLQPLGIAFDDFKLESCSTPSNLSAGSITMNSATLNWTENGSATVWDIEMGAAGFTPTGTPTQTGVISRPYTYTGLSSATNYSYYVRAACGEPWGNSSWAGPYSFSTNCDVVAVPYCQDFATSFFPACWSQSFSGISSDRWSITNTAIAGGTPFEARCTYHLGIGVSRLISPQLNTAGMSYVRVAFRQMFDDYPSGSGVSISLESRVNGGEWVPAWVHEAGVNADIPAELKEVNIAVSGDTMEFAWTVNGDHYNINYWYVDNVCITPLPCPPPTALTATSITTTSANLAWTPAGSETNWEYVYGVSPIATPAGSGTATISSAVNPITGLSAGTEYQFYVRANCGDGFSTWAGPYTFNTMCSGTANTLFPYTENFNDAVVPPHCWSEIIANADFHWKASTSDPGWADVEFDPAPASQDEWLVTPAMDFANLAHPRLSFKWMMSYYWSVSPYNNYDLNCKISTDGGTSWIKIWSETDEGTFTTYEAKTKTLDLLAYAGQANVKFAWQYVGNDGAQALIDDVVIDAWPLPCLTPKNLDANAITSSSANLAWVPGGSETNWEYVYGLSPLPSPASPGTATTSSNFNPISGLTDNTVYQYYVRATCGSDNSAWVGPFTFTTLPYNYSVTGEVTGTECYNATNILTVGGTPNTFTIGSTGNVTLIAGVQIRLLPGTTVENGGYLLGYITQTNTYCGATRAPMVAVKTGTDETPYNTDRLFFNLYPNPTTGNFILEQKGEKAYGTVKVEIFSMNGAKVLTETMTGEKMREFHFGEMPNGLYFVKVVADDSVETIKLVKTR